MSAPLFDAVTAHAKKQKVSMHMPAHKGNFSALGGIQSFDITEIPDTGSLFDGEGATALAEAQAQKLFGSAATFMSAGGCTLCIRDVQSRRTARRKSRLRARCPPQRGQRNVPARHRTRVGPAGSERGRAVLRAHNRRRCAPRTRKNARGKGCIYHFARLFRRYQRCQIDSGCVTRIRSAPACGLRPRSASEIFGKRYLAA